MSSIKPSQVMAIESLRKAPFCRMMGCRNTERVAAGLIEWLANNGDDWRTVITVELLSFGGDWDLDHVHPDGTECSFVRTFLDGRCVNDVFVHTVTRRGDYSEFRDDVLVDIIAGWPGER